MDELIKVSTDGQGASVVSARELHAFLEVKAKFQDWFKRRVIKYGFLEQTDYVEVEGVFLNFEKNLSDPDTDEVLPNSAGGRPLIDYALTLGMAKELAMVEGNTKGKQARQYFIRCEEMLRQAAQQPAALPATTEQVLLQLVSQSNQILSNQQAQLDRLRADVDLIMASHKQAPAYQTPPLPPQPLRPMISQLVLEYCSYTGVTAFHAWNFFYKRLLEVYGISAYRLQRIGTESIVDAVERYGHLDKLYTLIMAELEYPED